jgi:phenylalanine-4-hydroxylase
VFAEYMRAYGLGGLKAVGQGEAALQHLARLYWYTVEFGLIRGNDGLRIYGSGILSSAGESRHCLESAVPNRIDFNMERVMRTRYRIDSFQRSYFVIDSFEQLFEATRADFTPIYDRLRQAEDFPAGAVVPGDAVVQHGTGEGWDAGGDV